MSHSDEKKDEYMLTRTAGANVRLTMQHFVIKSSGADYHLHPSISNLLSVKEDLKIAEVGVGTCIWLVELAEKLPKSAQLDALDISFEQCPSKELLPSNISLIRYDAFAEPPPEMMGRYDVVHIQLFISLVKSESPVPLLQNFCKLLKTGGYIQWAEWDLGLYTKISRFIEGPPTMNHEVNAMWDYVTSLGGKKPARNFLNVNWVAELDDTFRRNGLDVVASSRLKYDKYHAYLLLDAWLVVAEEIASRVLDQVDEDYSKVLRALIASLAKKKKTQPLNVDWVVVVGQKRAA